MNIKLNLKHIDKPSETIMCKEVIASGSFADIYSTSCDDYVLKVMDLKHSKTQQSFVKEKSILESSIANHTNIIKCLHIQSVMNNTKGIFLLERCHSSLADFIQGINKPIPNSLLVPIIYQTANALKVMHLQGIIKLIDFGSSSESIIDGEGLDRDISRREEVQADIDNNTTSYYRSPEQCDLYSQQCITNKTDVWALGVVLFLLLFKRFPFEGSLAILGKSHNLNKEDYPQYAKQFRLLDIMWVIDQEKRADIQQVLDYLVQWAQEDSLDLTACIRPSIKRQSSLSTNSQTNREFKTGLFDSIFKQYKKITTYTEGWFLSLVHESDQLLPHQYLRKLIIKAWMKRYNVYKLFLILGRHVDKHVQNETILIKTLIFLHNYLRKGPPQVYTSTQDDHFLRAYRKTNKLNTNLQDILNKLSTIYAGNVYDSGQSFHPFISQLVQLLQAQQQLHAKYEHFIEGNFSINPFISNYQKTQGVLQQVFIIDMIQYFQQINNFNDILFINSDLQNLQISLQLSILDELYCLVSTLINVLVAYKKSTNYLNYEYQLIDYQQLATDIKILENKFIKEYKKLLTYCRQLKEMELFKNFKQLIPYIPEDPLDYLQNIKILENYLIDKKDFKNNFYILDIINNGNNNCPLKIPMSYGGAFTFQDNTDVIQNKELKLGFCFKAYKISQEQFQKIQNINESTNEKNKQTDKRFQEMFVDQHKKIDVLNVSQKLNNDKNPQENFNKNINQFEYFESEIDENNDNFQDFSHQHINETIKNSDELNNNNNKQVPLKVSGFNKRNAFKQNILRSGESYNIETSMLVDNVNKKQQEQEDENHDYFADEIDEKVESRNNLQSFCKSYNQNNLQEKEDENLLTKPEYLKEFISQKIQENIDGFIINYDDLKIIKQISQGATSEVFIGEWAGQTIAIKKIKTYLQENLSTLIKRELAALITIRPHSHLVSFLGACLKENMFHIVIEYCDGGNLFQLLHQNKDPSFSLSWAQKITFCQHISNGLMYLHTLKPPIMHRDLKSLNLMLDRRFSQYSQVNLKIADFGLAKTLTSEIGNSGVQGTYHWMAPEVFESKPYSLAADIYSYGIIMYEIITQTVPYASYAQSSPLLFMRYVTEEKGRPDIGKIPEECPVFLKNVMFSCWNHQPSRRPTIQQIQTQLNQARKK